MSVSNRYLSVWYLRLQASISSKNHQDLLVMITRTYSSGCSSVVSCYIHGLHTSVEESDCPIRDGLIRDAVSAAYTRRCRGQLLHQRFISSGTAIASNWQRVGSVISVNAMHAESNDNSNHGNDASKIFKKCRPARCSRVSSKSGEWVNYNGQIHVIHTDLEKALTLTFAP